MNYGYIYQKKNNILMINHILVGILMLDILIEFVQMVFKYYLKINLMVLVVNLDFLLLIEKVLSPNQT